MYEREFPSEALEPIEAEATEVVAGAPDALTVPMVGGRMISQAGGHAMARQVEVARSLRLLTRGVTEEARLMGEGAYYGWGAGKDRVEGPSIYLANVIARRWGNCAVEAVLASQTSDEWIFNATFVDLETGFTLTRPFRMSKHWTVYGKLDEPRKADVRFQIGASKATRNVILNSVPWWLIEKALSAAKEGVRERIEKYIKAHSLVDAQELALSALARAGVSEERVLQKFGIADAKALSLDHLVVIQGDLKALQSGEARPDQLYPRLSTAEAVGSPLDALADSLEQNGVEIDSPGEQGQLPIGTEKRTKK